MSDPLQQKSVPLITWANIAPPFQDHHYFEQADRFPFPWATPDFSLLHGWWLSEAALLAYAEESFATPRFDRAGFTRVRFFDAGSTQCYVASNAAYAIVAFRGTESRPRAGENPYGQFMSDWVTDFDIRMIPTPHGGRIHQGFDRALNEIWDELEEYLSQLTSAGCALWITGHSLGGALATLAAARIPRLIGVHTFGAPRVGDKTFAERFDKPLYRWVNNNDVVPHLPPFPYVDLGGPIYIDHHGAVDWEIGGWERIWDGIQGHLGAVGESISGGLPAWVPEGLKDHTPLLYTLRIWNNFIADRST
jgi:pimeloyl-ACP methyl ester carboxylesterase